MLQPSGRFLQCTECAHRGTACFYSDDPARRVWKEGGRVPATENVGCEAEAVLLANGSVLLNMRSNGPFPTYPNVSRSKLHRLLSRSDDGGLTFSAPRYAADLPDPLCQASTISAGGGQRIYTSGPRNQTHRADMTISSSSDGGASWQPDQLVWSGYSGYSSLVDLGGALGLAFEGGPGGDACTAISFVRIDVGLKTDDTDRAAQQRSNPLTGGSAIKDGRLMVDGESFFPVGAYTHDLSADDWAFLQASGYNTVLTYTNGLPHEAYNASASAIAVTKGFLDAAQAHGIHVFLSLKDMYSFHAPAGVDCGALVTEIVTAFRAHRALLGW